MARLMIGKRFARSEMEFELNHLGPYYINPENTLDYDGHYLANWRYSIDINPRIRFYSRVMNLMDTDYAERADVTFGFSEADRVPRYFVGHPRSLFLGFQYTW
jgi:outer membrane cobalamin receptor